MLIGMAMRPNALIISQRNRRPGFVDQSHGPLMAKVAPFFVTGAAERDCAALTAALCDRTSTSQSLHTAGVGKALRIITELGQLAWSDQFAHAWQGSEGGIVGVLAIKALQIGQRFHLGAGVLQQQMSQELGFVLINQDRVRTDRWVVDLQARKAARQFFGVRIAVSFRKAFKLSVL